MTKACITCSHCSVYSTERYRALVCRRFPPSIGDGESLWDEFAPAKFPTVSDNWFCGEWADASKNADTPETVSVKRSETP